MKVYTIITRIDGWNTRVYFADPQEAKNRVSELDVAMPDEVRIHGPIEQELDLDPKVLPLMEYGHENDGFLPDLTEFARVVARKVIEEKVSTEDADGKMRAADDIYSDAFVAAMQGLVESGIFDPEKTYPAEKDMEAVCHDEAQRVMYPWSATSTD